MTQYDVNLWLTNVFHAALPIFFFGFGAAIVFVGLYITLPEGGAK